MNNKTLNAFSLQNKVILVTGASSGLGRQIAISCAEQGARVIISGRNAFRLQSTFDQLPGTGHLQFIAEQTNAEERKALSRFTPQLNGVVHCMGKQMLSPIRQLSEMLMTQMYQVNFLAPVMLTQNLLHDKKIEAGGSIIFMLSTSAHIGTVAVGPYAAMKSALLGIIRCLALEQGKHRIRVNGLSPSVVPTPMWGDDPQSDALTIQRNRHPLGLGTPEDVANASIFLLSNASRWVTGTSLIMDGGVVL